MPSPQIAAFGTIRLGGNNVTTSGSNRLKIGANDATMLVSDSGAFTSSAVVQNTGQTLYNLVTGLSGQANTNYATPAFAVGIGTIISGNLASTGSALYVDVTGLSGQFNANQANFSTVIVTGTLSMSGSGTMLISFPTAFTSVPVVVNPTFQVYSGNSVSYMIWPSQVTTSNYLATFSDVVLETGNYVNTYAHV